MKDDCKEAERDVETALEAEVEKIVDDSEDEVKENDILRNRPHNGHVDAPGGVVSENDEENESDDFETSESVKFDKNGDI